MFRQCLLYILKIDTTIFFRVIPSISWIGIFWTEGKLGLHPGAFHDFTDILKTVLKCLPVIQMIEIDFPGNDICFFQIE